uniref:Putative ovule protein n=1 Tax=Solanum chacoense TaxID=4108 RepID=A0A0V0GRM6_SOLCH
MANICLPFPQVKGLAIVQKHCKSQRLANNNEREKVLIPVVESFDKDDHLIVDSLSSQGGRKHLNRETEKPVEEYTELQKDGKLVKSSG